MDEENQTVARPLPPEDIRPGDFIAPLRCIIEHVPPPWCREDWKGEVIRATHLPGRNCAPVEVVEVCLPYLLVRSPRGRHRMVDVRRYRLARVAPRFGRSVFAQAEADRRRKKAEAEEKATPPASPGDSQ